MRRRHCSPTSIYETVDDMLHHNAQVCINLYAFASDVEFVFL
jgi:hypothetical protein